MVRNKILANNRMIMPEDLAHQPAAKVATRGTRCVYAIHSPHFRRAVNNALVYWAGRVGRLGWRLEVGGGVALALALALIMTTRLWPHQNGARAQGPGPRAQSPALRALS